MATFTGNANTDDHFIGWAMTDRFFFSPIDLTSGDTVDGNGTDYGPSTDYLIFTNSGTIAAAAMANVRNIEVIMFNVGGISLTLDQTTPFAGIDDSFERMLTIRGSTGNDSVDASAIPPGADFTRLVNFIDVSSGGGGNDIFKGGGGNDIFRFYATDLNADDRIEGNAGSDQLYLYNAASLSAAALSGITGIEKIRLFNGGNSLTFDNAVLGANGAINGANRTLSITSGSDGGLVVDASGVTLATLGITVEDSYIGDNIVRGGAGNDNFIFLASRLNANDVVAGNGGYDTLILENFGGLVEGALTQVSGIEAINFRNPGGGTFVLTEAFFSNNGEIQGATRTVSFADTGNGSLGIIDASAITSTNHAVISLNSTLIGGAGNDIGRISFGTSAAFDGNGGNDILEYTSAVTITGSDLTRVSDVETIKLNTSNINFRSKLTLNDAVLAANGIVNGDNHMLAVSTSSANDIVDASSVALATHAIDITSGNGGNDMFLGGAGNDIFRFHATELNASDVVQGNGGKDMLILFDPAALSATALAGVSGIETIRFYEAGISLSLNNNVLNANGTADGANRTLNITGSSGADIVDASAATLTTRAISVTAGAGHDILIGGAGNDILEGGAGADEMTGNVGMDAVSYRGSATGVTVSLDGSLVQTGDAAGDTFSYIESLLGSATGNDFLRGNARNNLLSGGGGDDRLEGGEGNDWLAGGDGHDILTGGAGRDSFLFDSPIGPTSIDSITDFNVTDDQFRLDHDIFTGLPGGLLAASAFTTGTAATDTLDRIIYNSSTGALYFDVDGSGSAAAIQFASLDPGLGLSADNFVLV